MVVISTFRGPHPLVLWEGQKPCHSVVTKFLYGFQGQNRASATRHNMIGGTVHPLNWLVFREWGDKDFPCLKVSNGQSCRMCPHLQFGSCPRVWEMLISLSFPQGWVFPRPSQSSWADLFRVTEIPSHFWLPKEFKARLDYLVPGQPWLEWDSPKIK